MENVKEIRVEITGLASESDLDTLSGQMQSISANLVRLAKHADEDVPSQTRFRAVIDVPDEKWSEFRALIALTRASWSHNSYIATCRDCRTNRAMGFLTSEQEKDTREYAGPTAVSRAQVAKMRMTL